MNNVITSWKSMPIEGKPNHYWCPWCRSKGKHPNKFGQMITCITCSGTGILHDCTNPNCNNVVPYIDRGTKCITCQLNEVEDSSPDSDIKDIPWFE